MNVMIRTDASPVIGTGHVMRCAALGDALRRKGANVTFVMREATPAIEELLRQGGHTCVGLPVATAQRDEGWPAARWGTDAAQTLHVLESRQVDWLIVDRYGFDYRWEKRVRREGLKLLVIDDLAASTHDCDALLNQNIIAGAEARYRSLVPAECRLLLGPKFALLRDEFRDARANLHRNAQYVRRLLVHFGGGNAENVTLRALSVIEQLKTDELAVDVVVGAGNPRNSEIEKRYGGKPGYQIIRQSTDMPGLMLGADLAVGAGGISTWERCCLGLPSLVLAIAENQEEVGLAGAEVGTCLYLGQYAAVSTDGLAAALRLLLGNAGLRRLLSESGLRLVDGNGAERVARVLLQRPVSVRPARLDDGERLFTWRNAEVTRRHSHDVTPLNLEDHLKWLRACLEDGSRALLIGENDTRAVGALRYDLKGTHATVSIYLDPTLHGRGYGPGLLLAGEIWLRKTKTEIRSMRAEIAPANEASRSAFEEAGFRMHGYLFGKDLHVEQGLEATAS